MAMPEAAVHEHHLAQSHENEVRATGEVSAMEPEPVSQLMDQAPDGQLWLRVLPADARH